jgi:hypothetical protein
MCGRTAQIGSHPLKKRHDGERIAQTEGEGVITGLSHLWRGLLVGLFKRSSNILCNNFPALVFCTLETEEEPNRKAASQVNRDLNKVSNILCITCYLTSNGFCCFNPMYSTTATLCLYILFTMRSRISKRIFSAMA